MGILCTHPGCGRPSAIENNLTLAQPDLQSRKVLTATSLSEEDDWRERQQREKDVLTRTDQQRILEAMGMVGEGVPPPDGSMQLVPATHGVRWSDVYLSVYNAALEDGVDLGMLSYDEQPWGWTFRFKTLDNKPAEMVVRRADPPIVYRATASVGRWGEDEARATRLLEAFDSWMKKYGKKPGEAE